MKMLGLYRLYLFYIYKRKTLKQNQIHLIIIVLQLEQILFIVII